MSDKWLNRNIFNGKPNGRRKRVEQDLDGWMAECKDIELRRLRVRTMKCCLHNEEAVTPSNGLVSETWNKDLKKSIFKEKIYGEL